MLALVKTRNQLIGYFLLTLLGLLLIQSVFFAPQSETLSYRDFKTLPESGQGRRPPRGGAYDHGAPHD